MRNRPPYLVILVIAVACVLLITAINTDYSTTVSGISTVVDKYGFTPLLLVLIAILAFVLHSIRQRGTGEACNKLFSLKNVIAITLFLIFMGWLLNLS